MEVDAFIDFAELELKEEIEQHSDMVHADRRNPFPSEKKRERMRKLRTKILEETKKLLVESGAQSEIWSNLEDGKRLSTLAKDPEAGISAEVYFGKRKWSYVDFGGKRTEGEKDGLWLEFKDPKSGKLLSKVFYSLDANGELFFDPFVASDAGGLNRALRVGSAGVLEIMTTYHRFSQEWPLDRAIQMNRNPKCIEQYKKTPGWESISNRMSKVLELVNPKRLLKRPETHTKDAR